MDSPPSLWQQVKNAVRYILCRHKHTEVRTVRTGSDLKNLKVLYRFRYCFNCKNRIYDKKLDSEEQKG